MNLLLDTNVIIDYLGKQQPFYGDAERVMAMGFFGDATLWAPAQSFKDAYFVLSHFVDQARVQDAISTLLDIVRPVDLTGNDIVAATRMKWDDFEDCLVAVSAGKAGVDYLVTRDKKGFKRSSIPVISPSDLVELMRETQRVSYDSIELSQ